MAAQRACNGEFNVRNPDNPDDNTGNVFTPADDGACPSARVTPATASQRKHGFFHGNAKHGKDITGSTLQPHPAPNSKEKREKLKAEPDEDARRQARGETNFSDIIGGIINDQ